eukprot:Awhi_evm2s1489
MNPRLVPYVQQEVLQGFQWMRANFEGNVMVVKKAVVNNVPAFIQRVIKGFPQDENIQSSSLATLSWMTEVGLNNFAMLSLKMYLKIQKSLRFGILIENCILLRNKLYCLDGLF